MAKRIKLTKAQQEKLDKLREYLKKVDSSIYVGDQDVFTGCTLLKVECLVTKVKIKHYHPLYPLKIIAEDIQRTEITELYRAAMKHDEDFKKFIEESN